MSIHDPCPECGRRLRIELYKYAVEENVFVSRNLPDAPPRNPTVTLPRETIKRYRDDHSALIEFAAWVCGVDSDKLCTSDIMKATGEWKSIGDLMREANGVDE